MLIDDSTVPIIGMVNNGLDGVLFGDDPWQIMPIGIEPTARMNCWSDVTSVSEVLGR